MFRGRKVWGEKDTVFLHLRFLNLNAELRGWVGGGGLSISLLLGILEFIGCSKGYWLIQKALFYRHLWVFEANGHNKMFRRRLND